LTHIARTQNSSFSTSRSSWEGIAEKLTQAAGLYAKAPTGADGEAQASVIAFLYTSCVLRHASLLFAIWSAKGWGPLAFATMLQPGPQPTLPPTLTGPDALSLVHLERLSTLTGITRAEMSAVVAEAHGPWLLHLGPRERIATLEAMAGMYACIGHRRKETYVLREVLGCIMDLVVVGREDPASRGGNSISVVTPSGLGIQNVAIPGAGSVGVRENEATEGNESILRVVKHICRVHGVDLEAVKLVDPTAEATEDAADADDATDGASPETFGWPELQIGIVREALAVAEALPGTSACYSSLRHIR
jgi:hypothetical protein